MKKKMFFLAALAAVVAIPGKSFAVDANTVEIVYNGSTATVTVADNISQYVTVNSGTSSHVQIVQSAAFTGVDATVDNEDGEIIYALSGTSTDGEFYMEGSYKCTVVLNSLTLTNPSGAAIAVMNGKRVAVSVKKGTTNTLTDAANDTYNGCFHCKGHTKLKGKGILNVVGNSKHAIYSKEYVEVKNLTLNITGAVKDAIHCKEYFLMESGTVNISAATEDGIQVELSGTSSTGTTTNHDDEDSGNFYMEDGTLTIGNYGGKAVKADGSITFSGGTQNFDTSDITVAAGIASIANSIKSELKSYDLHGRRVSASKPGIYILKGGDNAKKVILK